MHLPLRPFAWQHLDGVVDLLAACELVDRTGSVVSREALEMQFGMPGFDPSESVWYLPGDGDAIDALCTIVALPGDGIEVANVAAHVRPCRRGDDIDDRLMAFAEGHTPRVRKRADLPAVWHRGLLSTWPDRIGVCERRGYRPVRWFLELERGLRDSLPDAELPSGFRALPVAEREDVIDLHAALNEAFRDHWNPVDFTLERFDHYVDAPSMQPLRMLLARADDGSPAGGCIVRVEREKNEQRGTREGDVMVLGVRRPYRGRGVARGLLAAGMQWLADQDMGIATITVDANSPTGADRLYASVGFIERRRSVVYEKPVP